MGISELRQAAAGTEVVDPAELPLELAQPGAGEVFQAALRGVEALHDGVERAGELDPLLAEAAQALEQLVGRALEAGVLDRLAHHRQHCEQGDRRAEHHLLAQRHVDELGVVLVDEGVDGLVGDEQQNLVERRFGLDVPAARQLLDAVADVAQERGGGSIPLGVRRCLEIAQVVVDGELHVHVQLAPAR